MRKPLAIIPARGGSKRIPRKNIKHFLGRPIIEYSINSAIESQLFEEVMVSTDDFEIAEISRNAGASVPFLRSKNKADDFTGTAEVLMDVVNQYKTLGRVFQTVCCIYPTAPFITSKFLKSSFSKFENSNCDSLFPILQFDSPIQRALIQNANGKLEMKFPENYSLRSQDFQPCYHDAGQFYWVKVESLEKYGKLWMINSEGIVISQLQAQDIDTLEDWKIAEWKYSLVNNSNYDV